jgi:ABC-type spermidine/putrescine transport system permease subunit II
LDCAAAAFAAVDAELELAARNIGASGRRTALTVTLRLAEPGMMAAAIFVFLESLDEFTGTYFVGVPDVTALPLMTGKPPFLNLQEPVGCCRRPIGLISDDATRC